MKQFWFKTGLGVLGVLFLGTGIFLLTNPAAAFQGVSTPIGVYVTVGNPPDGTNVRSGPNSVHYGPPIGHLKTGDTARALGKSPGGDWVQIEFPGGFDGTGWVYSANIVVSGGELPIVEPPPTATLPVTPTFDLTLAAAFDIQPTQTRLPTFTPPPPLAVPTFTEESHVAPNSVFGIFIIGLGLIGGIGLLVSFLLRK